MEQHEVGSHTILAFVCLQAGILLFMFFSKCEWLNETEGDHLKCIMGNVQAERGFNAVCDLMMCEDVYTCINTHS